MVLKIMRWFFAVVAGCAAFVALWVAWMAGSFGGTFFDRRIIYWAACFLLFLVFLRYATWGAVAFASYLLAGWILGWFMPLRSGIDTIILVCGCGVGLSYACFCAAKIRGAEPRE